MGRLQRYLRRLTIEEWSALHEDALQELRGKSLALLERLRSTGVPQTLTPSEKELAKRIERWIWKRAFIAKHQRHPLYKASPPEWELLGAQLYAQAGLWREALFILNTPYVHPAQNFLRLYLRLQIEAQHGRIEQAYGTVQSFLKLLHQLRWNVEGIHLQILLMRLLRQYGGSYTEKGQKLLQKLSRSKRWKAPLPDSPKDLAIEVNLRSIYALACGEVHKAYELS